MAYASKYYDPDKAHDYYIRTRELKGYEDRYGGWRGNGTSGGSGGVTNSVALISKRSSGNSYSSGVTKIASGNSHSSGVTKIASNSAPSSSNGNSLRSEVTKIASSTSSKSTSSSQKTTSTRNAGEERTTTIKTLSGAVLPSKYTVRASTGNDDLDKLLESYDKLRSGLKAYREDSKRNDNALRNDMRNATTREDKIGFKDALDYNKSIYKQDTDKIKSDIDTLKTAIKQRREAIKQEKQRQREEAKKEKQRQREEARQQREKKIRNNNAQYEIQNRFNSERDTAIKKVNKSVDDDMLTEAKRFVDKVNKQRKSGKRINNKAVLSQLRALSGRAKKAKIKYARQYTNNYKNKYKEELARYKNQ